MESLRYKDLSYKVIGCAMKVHQKLGPGFLEKVYENALMIELAGAGIKAIQQAPIQITYNQKIVGDYFADILVDDKIILELKATEKLLKIHQSQVINYLNATGIELGILINFAEESLNYKRLLRLKDYKER